MKRAALTLFFGAVILVAPGGFGKEPDDTKKAVSAVFKDDKTKDDWKLLEDIPFDGKQFTPDFVEFLKQGESEINGEVMRQRAKELNANLGQRHAEYLLEYQELIPKEWRGKHCLVFSGTIWQASDGLRYVPCLYHGRDGWCLVFRWLGQDWRGFALLVSLRK